MSDLKITAETPIKHAWDKTSLHFHCLLSTCVLIQVAILLFKWYIPMDTSLYAYRGAVFQYHMYIGIFTFFVALAFFITKLCDQHKVKFLRLYPYNKPGLTAIASDLNTLFHGRLPVRSAGGLAGMIQGLGLLLVLGLGFLGTVAFTLWNTPVGPSLSHWGSTIIGFHKDLGVLLWWYLAGHMFMATLHKLLPKKWQEEKA